MSSPLRVAVRADAGPALGSGHVMRCLTLAAALRQRGAQVHFVCRDGAGHLGGRIAADGHGLTLLGKTLTAEQDAHHSRAALAEAWRGAGCDLLLVDHYQLDASWEQALRPACRRLAAIDDLADRPHAVDLLLDQNLGRMVGDYAALLPAAAVRLIGPRYALLRPEFAAARTTSLARRGTGSWRHLLLSLGGADPHQGTLHCLQALAACPLPPDVQVTVVLGALASTRPSIQALLPTLPFATRLLTDVADMAPLLAEADLAIGAAGGSAWERCCLGLPSLLLVLADNQRPGTQALDAAGAALSLGGIDDLAARLPAALQQLAQPGRLAALSAAASAITDGQGAARVADALLALHQG
ncbi:UDP-2,4-diacetamido-2,4,6-trideoxy-beta-L-altropyranose hydrolase [Pseudaquabacterium pictum]|uniref:UDP-2,4-diacetamido-2,4,6-trideoxy-beta-L-altropy ranose hydrolase n=1 Tax=Pseudaquabacterium pictum TaxID=2315236 RepID=A0A480ARI0_9BURK|nr:UDP-2,4-diacetamido-2,4,6-trideoxy-beta-L-altropyranose hydrolase [Rubrivivax pictus]GCL62642.1 UDP-2,4-diacetamido-2,4,6-trideoxy-beta-L-altropy ranose hydrolase [Rubrivivax pictus]